MRTGLAILMVLSSIYTAHAFVLGKEGFLFGRMGFSGGKKAAVIADCASPTAPNGVVDLSLCSNASYVALIF